MTATTTSHTITTLPESFNNADSILALFHLQGSVDAGYHTINSDIYHDVNIANYTRILGGKTNANGEKLPDNGGQTAADLERLLHSAQTMPSLMFAMNGDIHSTEPLIMEHAKQGCESAYVVYLPFSIFKEAGITGEEDFVVMDDAGSHFVPKEQTMKRYEELYPKIAQAAADFIRDNINHYHNKNIILDGNYIDAGQTVLHTQDIMQPDMQDGTVISIYTPHTLGINKLNSLLNNTIENIEYRINESGANQQIVSQLNTSDLLEQYRDITHLIALGTDPKIVADTIRDYSEHDEADDIERLMNAMKEAELRSTTINLVDALLRSESLSALSDKFASVERMTMESGENLKRFDGIMAVSQEMQTQTSRWTEGQTPVGFVLNGFNSDIFNPYIFNDVASDAVSDRAVDILSRAYEPSQYLPYKKIYNIDIDTDAQDSQFAETQAKQYFGSIKERLLEDRTKSTIFIAASRPDERKGSDLTLEAFGEYVKRTGDKEATLALVSHKPGNPLSEMDVTLQNIIQRYGIGDQVLLLPQLQAQDIRTLYALPNAVGLAPSLNEPWGIVAIEQVGAGVPIIASSKYNAAQYVHTLQEQEQRFSMISFSSPSEEGTSRNEAVADFSNAMEEMNNNYELYKANTHYWADHIIDKFQWKATTDEYLQFSQDRIKEVKDHTFVAHNDNTQPSSAIVETATHESLHKPPDLGRTG